MQARENAGTENFSHEETKALRFFWARCKGNARRAGALDGNAGCKKRKEIKSTYSLRSIKKFKNPRERKSFFRQRIKLIKLIFQTQMSWILTQISPFNYKLKK